MFKTILSFVAGAFETRAYAVSGISPTTLEVPKLPAAVLNAIEEVKTGVMSKEMFGKVYGEDLLTNYSKLAS